MAVKLISDYIPQQLAKYLGKHVLDGTLVKVASGSRGATVSGGTQPTETSYACKLWISDFDDAQAPGTQARQSDRWIRILGAALPAGVAPEPNDKITAEGVTYRVVPEVDGGRGVKRDSVGAVFRCHARG